MVRIRLTRVGAKKQPSYRIIVTDGRKARDSRYLEVVGHYNPRTRPSTEVIKEDRALYWLSVGAQPSEAVERILKRTGTLDRYTRLKGGEDVNALVKEAIATAKPLPDPRTNYPSPGPGESTQKSKK
jgi:small subunit ribosomal protein S16